MTAALQTETPPTLRLVPPPAPLDQTVTMLARHMAADAFPLMGACLPYHDLRDEVVALYPITKDGYDLEHVTIGLVTAATTRRLEDGNESTLYVDEVAPQGLKIFGGGDNLVVLAKYARTGKELRLDGNMSYGVQLLGCVRQIENETHIIGRNSLNTYTPKDKL